MSKEITKNPFKKLFSDPTKRNEMYSNTKLQILRDDSEEQNPILEFRIVLEQWSQYYGKYYKWREKIALSAFDESLRESEAGERIIHSYVDHDQTIKSMIGSTGNENVKLFKENNEIVMQIPVEEDNKLAMKVYQHIKNGDITANSFIFTCSEDPIVDEVELADGTFIADVTITKGELISIDPVSRAFYKFNIMEARGIKEDTESITPNKDEQKHKKEIFMRKSIINSLVARDMNIDTLNEMTDEKLFETYEVKKREEMETMIKESKLSDEENQKMRDAFTTALANVKTNLEDTTELRNQVVALETKEEKRANLEDSKSALKTFLRGKHFVKGTAKLSEAAAKAMSTRNTQVSEDLTAEETSLYQLNRDITGGDIDTGSQLIPVAIDKDLIGEDLYAIPELDGVRRLPIIGEQTTKVPINITPDGTPTKKSPNDPADKVDTNAVTSVLSPELYSEYFSWNPRMSAHVATIEQSTIDVINRHRQAWRTEFPVTLLQHIGQTWASLKGADPALSLYKGGATIESIVESTVASALALEDFDAMSDPLEAKYGDTVGQKYRWYMNSTTWGKVKAIVRSTPNDITVRVDLKNKTINDIKVITNDAFTQNIVDGEHPVVLYSNEDMRVYGGDTVMKDSSEAEFLARKGTRRIDTYGEVKLFDPYFRTRVLKIKATV